MAIPHSEIQSPKTRQEFHYPPLEASDEELSIRLLKLSATGRDANDVGACACGQLEAFRLFQAPPYHALSYMWGSPFHAEDLEASGHADVDWDAATHVLLINDQRFPIRPSLAAFFQQLGCCKPSAVPGYLWIDALCINQADANERSRQVQRMGRIYEKATCVLIWLGPVGEHVKPIARAMQDWDKLEPTTQERKRFLAREPGSASPSFDPLHKRLAYWPRWQKWHWWNGGYRSESGQSWNDIHLSVRLLLDDRHRLPDALKLSSSHADNSIALQSRAALSELGCRRYWSRIWIVQEMYLTSAATVQCGSEQFSLETLFRTWVLFHAISTDSGVDWKKAFRVILAMDEEEMASRPVENIFDPDGRMRFGPPPSRDGVPVTINCFTGLCRWRRARAAQSERFLELVWQFREFDCSDVRDKVYSLMGLAGKVPSRQSLQVNYASTAPELLLDLVQLSDREGHALSTARLRKITDSWGLNPSEIASIPHRKILTRLREPYSLDNFYENLYPSSPGYEDIGASCVPYTIWISNIIVFGTRAQLSRMSKAAILCKRPNEKAEYEGRRVSFDSDLFNGLLIHKDDNDKKHEFPFHCITTSAAQFALILEHSDC